MKKILTVIAVLFTAQLFAQTHEIIKHDGEKIAINFIKIEGNIVFYSFPNSMEEQKISRYAVSKLNEIEKNNSKIVSERIILTQQSDYKKVVLLNESETIGLRKVDNLTSYLGIAKGETSITKFKMGEMRLKQNAAKKGYQFIVILFNNSEKMKAVAYTY